MAEQHVGTIPHELGNCRALKVIDSSENLLTGLIPVALGSLSKLEELQLSVNQLSDDDLLDFNLDNDAKAPKTNSKTVSASPLSSSLTSATEKESCGSFPVG
ncbi:hypothetical protein ACS0TY_021023 [Phlomoides rotata]